MNDQPDPGRQALRFSRTVSGSRVWLAAGRRVAILDDEFRIFGYIPDSCLGQEAHWRRRTSEVRNTLEQRMLQDQGARLEQALESAITEITAYLVACKAEGLEPNLRKLREFWSCGDLDLGSVGKGLAQSLHDLRAKQRHRDLAEQMLELKGLRGKNTSVIKHMRSRIEQEQGDFDVSGARIHAVRSVHLKLLREVFALLGTGTLKIEMGELTKALRQPGIKLGVKKAYAQTFDRLRDGLRKAQATSVEIQNMLGGTFRQLNAEYGFSLQAPPEPDLARYIRDLDLVERSHTQYLGVGNALKLAQPDFADRLVRALATRLRVVYESALGEVELWNKSAAAQLDAQLRERRRNFGRRIEAIERIQQAATGLDDRIAEIDQQEDNLNQLDAKLIELTAHLIDTPAGGDGAHQEPALKTA